MKEFKITRKDNPVFFGIVDGEEKKLEQVKEIKCFSWEDLKSQMEKEKDVKWLSWDNPSERTVGYMAVKDEGETLKGIRFFIPFTKLLGINVDLSSVEKRNNFIPYPRLNWVPIFKEIENNLEYTLELEKEK